MARIHNTNPDALICTFTANVVCPTCGSGILMSWRANETIAPSAQNVMTGYRARHMPHPDFAEGLPGIGMHAITDTIESGTTLVSMVVAQPHPSMVGNYTFKHTSRPTVYTGSTFNDPPPRTPK